LAAEDLTFWLCHDENISNPRRKRQIQQPIAELAARVGPAWGDTLERLQALRAALPASPSLAAAAPWHHRLPRFEQRVRPSRIPLRTEASSRKAGESQLHRSADTEPAFTLSEVPNLTEPSRPEAYPDTLRPAPPIAIHSPSVIATAQTKNAANVTLVTQELKPFADTSVARRVALLLLSTPSSHSILDAFQSHLTQRFGGQFGEAVTSVSSSRAEELRILPSLVAQFEREFVLVIRPRVLFFGQGVPFLAEAQRRLLVEPVTTFVTAHVGPPVGPLGTARSVTANEQLAWQGAKGYFRFRSPPSSYFLCRRTWLLSRLTNLEEQSLDGVLATLLRDANALAIALPSKGFYGLDFSQEFTQQSWTELAVNESELQPLGHASCPQKIDNVMQSRRQL
jgi:hypothetical protein